jgi:hypothetical protein
MKQTCTIFLISALLSIVLTGSVFAAEIWVSPKGSDTNTGTRQRPLATVAMALRKVRELRRLNDTSVKGGVRIMVESGIYQLSEPLFVRPEDSGTFDSPTIVEGIGKGEAVLSGGISINGWKKVEGDIPGLPNSVKGKVWVADAPLAGDESLQFRQLWINNIKATPARETALPSMNRILSWNHQTQSCWIPKPADFDTSHIRDMEMFIHQWWAIAILRVKSATVVADSVKLSFYQPESRIQSEHPWPAPWISKKTGNSAFYLSRSINFLNQPGEWFQDVEHRKIYYIPRPGEDLSAATVTIPNLETLMKIEGTADRPVSYISFKNISFQHTSWLRPSKYGLVPHQAGMYMLDAYKLKIPGTPNKKRIGKPGMGWPSGGSC